MRKRDEVRGPTDPWEAPDPSLALAMQQMHWYAKHRDRARVAHMTSEVLILVITAATTLAAALQASPWVTASLAAGSLVLTGLRKLFDWQDNWTAFADAWTQVRAAINDYRLIPEDRRDEEAKRRLVSQVDEIVGADTERWASRRRSLADSPPEPGRSGSDGGR
ncbi:DUF4231 domain-containing protein [Actinoallomurus iriomotensis]|uniref:Uncharacterized protein n=1 Tax=Actinoallomurus iriomotensis TaxID=478107 RepID=A0A9W6VXX1_9ACTN|nr:DUF4231 domain-containing protein [Actinoallomurus iriomotensis]GLY83077.1 hypothetical protein Airi02_010070 [Actinoallomurus iriomotensis]